MAGNLSERVPSDGSGDEIDRLAVNLNEMLERIEQLMTGMREVSDNIAHDLKTPLNRMRNRVESALRDEDETSYRAALEQTIEDSDNLIRTFNALLAVARLEAGNSQVQLTDIDLQNLLHDVSELYEPAFEERGARLVLCAGAPLVVSVDRQLIGQALANLIDNALKYGRPADATLAPVIELKAWYDKDAVFIDVMDNGPGIPAELRADALKRFGRLERSRSEPGTGLGLALVAAVAKLHGGRLSLEDGAPGLRCRIMIPRRAPAAR
jgi:signal transduction histidine kinase